MRANVWGNQWFILLQLLYIRLRKDNMSGMEDVKDQERVVEDVPEDSEKAVPSSQEEVVSIYHLSSFALYCSSSFSFLVLECCFP